MLQLPPTDAASTFLSMTEDEFAAIFNLMKERQKQAKYDFSYYDRLWPITDIFEALCLSQNIGVPSYERIPRAMVIKAFNAINPDALSAEQAMEWHYFQAMEPSEFSEMFNELYNPLRLYERQEH